MKQPPSSLFDGFDAPTENWCKLPNGLIDNLSLIETVSELKVILYILRHTWGFRSAERWITLDEFANGRRRKDHSRYDGGTGLSIPSIIAGLRKARAHGFIVERVDRTDMGRIKKYYRLREVGEPVDYPPEDEEPLPDSDVSKNFLEAEAVPFKYSEAEPKEFLEEMADSSQNFLGRTEKDNIERHYITDNSAVASVAKDNGVSSQLLQLEITRIIQHKTGDIAYCPNCRQAFAVNNVGEDDLLPCECGQAVWPDWYAKILRKRRKLPVPANSPPDYTSALVEYLRQKCPAWRGFRDQAQLERWIECEQAFSPDRIRQVIDIWQDKVPAKELVAAVIATLRKYPDRDRSAIPPPVSQATPPRVAVPSEVLARHPHLPPDVFYVGKDGKVYLDLVLLQNGGVVGQNDLAQIDQLRQANPTRQLPLDEYEALLALPETPDQLWCSVEDARAHPELLLWDGQYIQQNLTVWLNYLIRRQQ